MNRLIKLGLAAALVVGGASAAYSVDTKVGAQAGAAAGADTNAAAGSMSTDVTTTGSVNADANYGSLISSLQTGTSADLTAFNPDSSTINCVMVSSLKGDASGDAQALDSALSRNQEALTSFHATLQGNAAFIDKVKSSCQVADLDVNKILAVKTGADGAYTVYIDDRA